MSALVIIPGFRVTDSNGDLVAGAKLYAYLTGTVTPVALYLDSAMASPATSPVIADASGMFPDLYAATPPIRIELKDASGVEIADVDPYSSGGLVLAANSYTRPAAGAVTRPLLDKIGELVNVKDFGAIGDGVNDDTAEIQAAITYLAGIGSGTLYFPHGTYLLSTTLTLTKPVLFVGEGNGFVAYGVAPLTGGTTIKWVGASGQKMFRFFNVNFGGWGMKRIWLDANSLASKCIELDSSSGGVFEQNTCTQFRTTGVHLTSTVAATCSWNTFTNLRADSVVAGMDSCIRLSGFVSLGNACFNQFNNTAVAHDKNAYGIVLGGCDNNVFYATYINSNGGGGTGAGVKVDTTEQSGFPSNDSFYRLSAGPYGWSQPNNTPLNGPQIFGYARDNGEPLPSVGTSQLFYTVNGSVVLGKIGSIGMSAPGNNFYFDFTAANSAGAQAVTLPNAEPDVNYEVIIFPRQQVTPAVVASYTPASRTTAGFNMFLSSAPGASTSWGILIIRR